MYCADPSDLPLGRLPGRCPIGDNGSWHVVEAAPFSSAPQRWRCLQNCEHTEPIRGGCDGCDEAAPLELSRRGALCRDCAQELASLSDVAATEPFDRGHCPIPDLSKRQTIQQRCRLKFRSVDQGRPLDGRPLVANDRAIAKRRDAALVADLTRALWHERKRRVVPSEAEAVAVATRLIADLRTLRLRWARSPTGAGVRVTGAAIGRGRPRSFRRRVLLYHLAHELESANLEPTKSEDGVFARVASIVLPSFDVPVPSSRKKLFPDIEYAVDAWNASKGRSVTPRKNVVN